MIPLNFNGIGGGWWLGEERFEVVFICMDVRDVLVLCIKKLNINVIEIRMILQNSKYTKLVIITLQDLLIDFS